MKNMPSLEAFQHPTTFSSQCRFNKTPTFTRHTHTKTHLYRGLAGCFGKRIVPTIGVYRWPLEPSIVSVKLSVEMYLIHNRASSQTAYIIQISVCGSDATAQIHTTECFCFIIDEIQNQCNGQHSGR